MGNEKNSAEANPPALRKLFKDSAVMYKLNSESPIVKALWELAFQIAKHDAAKTLKEEVKVTV